MAFKVPAEAKVWLPTPLMASVDRLRNEPASNRAARPSDENTHRVLPFVLLVTSRGSRGPTSMTLGAGEVDQRAAPLDELAGIFMRQLLSLWSDPLLKQEGAH